MVLTVSFVLSPVTWLFCHRHRRDAKHRRQLDTCLGVSGPHDFAVRVDIARLATSTRSSHPAPRFVTIGRNAPLSGDGTARTSIYDLPDEQSGKFFVRGLDRANQVDLPDEINFRAHAIFKSTRARQGLFSRSLPPETTSMCYHRYW